jgi:hypothetical protein
MGVRGNEVSGGHSAMCSLLPLFHVPVLYS